MIMFTLPTILLDLPPDHPRENMLNSSKLMYQADQDFQKKCDARYLQSLYEQQQQHIDLMNQLTDIPPEFYNLPFHLWGTTSAIIECFN